MFFFLYNIHIFAPFFFFLHRRSFISVSGFIIDFILNLGGWNGVDSLGGSGFYLPSFISEEHVVDLSV